MAVLTSGPQDCYRIRNRDSQNSCLAMAKGEKQYCYRIQNRDQQNMCLAQVTREKQYCYRITERDEKNRCLGLVRYEPPRVCRRLFRLSYATLAGISSLA